MRFSFQSLNPFRRHPRWFYQDAGRFQVAFTMRGRRFYKYAQDEQMAVLRGFAADDVYAELQNGSSREYMKALGAQLLSIKNVAEARMLGADLMRRNEWPVNTELLWKLASVMFFDATESPYGYDPDYAIQKIRFWKQGGDTVGFMLRKPMIDFLPSSLASASSFHTYTEGLALENRRHIRRVLAHLAQEQQQPGAKSLPATTPEYAAFLATQLLGGSPLPK